jgi:hypothetical protein
MASHPAANAPASCQNGVIYRRDMNRFLVQHGAFGLNAG